MANSTAKDYEELRRSKRQKSRYPEPQRPRRYALDGVCTQCGYTYMYITDSSAEATMTCKNCGAAVKVK